LNQQLAGDGGHGDVALAFAGKQLPAPFAQVAVPAHPQHGVSSLDEEAAHVAPAALPDAQLDVFAAPALSLARVESDVGDEFGGCFKAPDVADETQKSFAAGCLIVLLGECVG
jgi:hypothetical protein